MIESRAVTFGLIHLKCLFTLIQVQNIVAGCTFLCLWLYINCIKNVFMLCIILD